MNVEDIVIEVEVDEQSILHTFIYEIDKEEKPIENNSSEVIIIDEFDVDSEIKEHNKNIERTDNQKDEEFIKKLLLCSLCKSIPDDIDAVELPNCGHRFCKACLSKYIKDIGLNQNNYKCPNDECSDSFMIDHWLVSYGVLKEEDYNEYELFKFKQIFPEEQIMYCINPLCKCCFIFEDGEIHDSITGETDSEGNLMNLETIQHRDKYRIRCTKCNTNWCIKCNVTPYHLGKTCEEYDKYIKLRKCRYCNNILEDQLSKFDMCNAKECKEKRKRSCGKRLKCGHPCFGIKRCKCIPCLIPDCDKHDKSIDSADDYCSICFSESLSQAPCIQLECGHIFHYNCIDERLKNRWTGDRITFTYLYCPLCHRIIDHPSLAFKMENDLLLMSEIRKKTLEYLKVENMMNDKELTDPSSEYYNKPEEYGLNKFAFYLCEKCNKPYYAGLAECGEPPVDEVVERLCSDCQFRDSNIQECPKHGKEYIQFKCRYCCNVSRWFCFNTTHFCNDCHDRWMELRNKPKYELPQCLGREYCPLGVAHPPNGEEYCLGCGLCRFENASLT